MMKTNINLMVTTDGSKGKCGSRAHIQGLFIGLADSFNATASYGSDGCAVVAVSISGLVSDKSAKDIIESLSFVKNVENV